ncbi:interleukin-12 receptor subunit beta-1 isoform X2 [Dendropsophus ebraccatus]|uniref:interleukin-12 receptor subunit beta-1 isoform X2 n=1 Tax=Dendropsophus ebraccatus TaxID=150705 RepID=UPI0038312E78
MKWIQLLPTHAGSRTGMSILYWLLLLCYTTAGQQTGMNKTKKAPEDLICYQNYTLYDNFCYCSWRAGEDSQNPTYTLQYCLHRDDTECSYFNVGSLSYISLSNDVVHMRENISIEVIAEENGQNYISKQITLILDQAVKLDPPDHRKITITRKGNNITASWIRPEFFSVTLNTKKEVRYKRYKRHSLYSDPLPCKVKISTTCSEDGIPTCKEYCMFALDGDQGHDIQIRQTYEEGVWSEWSSPIFVPAEIGPVQIENITTRRLNHAGIRTVLLLWKPSTEEEGNMKFLIHFTFLPCSGVTTNYTTNQNWFQANISGAAYNVTIIASNQAQTASPWSTVIEEDCAAIAFKKVTFSGNNLTMKWKGKKTGKTRYSIVWKTSDMKEEHFIKENLNNNATIQTDTFLPMRCYKICIHNISENHNTVGAVNYFKAVSSVGPRDLTVMNVTANSILLKWEAFDLHECQMILQNWIISSIDHETNVSNEIYENSSVTQHLVEELPPGYNYTFAVKGITIYGEQTGNSFKSVSSPWKAENTSKRHIENIGIPVASLIALGLIVLAWCKIKECVCQDLPNPSNSIAATFPLNENKSNLSRPHLVHTSYEEKTTEPLIIETSMMIKTVKETVTPDMVSTKRIFDNDIVMADMDTEVETDLQFEYRKQVTPMTPINENTHFFDKMKDDLPCHVDCPKENDALLSPNAVNISTHES